MGLKYAATLANIPNCPPRVTPRSGTSYRLFFDDPNHQYNYLPPAVINPKRTFEDDEEHCDGYGLSMYETEAQARAAARALFKPGRKRPKSIGPCIGCVDLRPADGLATLTSGNGHFSLHEAANVVWAGRHRIVGRVADDPHSGGARGAA